MKKTITVLLIAICAMTTNAQENSNNTVGLMSDAILSATLNNDYAALKEVSAESMLRIVNKKNFSRLSERYSGTMEKGYEKSLMGVINKSNYDTYFWKIDIEGDSKIDLVLQASIRKGKVLSFSLK